MAALAGADSGGLSPALRGLGETFIPPGSRCLNVGHPNDGAMRLWLRSHGCSSVNVAASQAAALAHEDGRSTLRS